VAATALISTWVVAASACGGTPSARTATPHAHDATNRAAAASDPCANVTTTTPLEEVTAGCQELWSPYGVTEVPPADELQLEHVPPAPRVVNMTGGAVSDATAQRWADASNRDSGWWKWAQAHDQLYMLRFLVGPALIPAVEVEAPQDGATIAQPDCNLYPISATLFAMGTDGRAYFARKHLPTDDTYVFAVVYTGPCSETVTYPGGRSATIVDGTRQATVLSPGYLRSDPVLGDIWFGDAGGTCEDAEGPPAAWCGR